MHPPVGRVRGLALLVALSVGACAPPPSPVPDDGREAAVPPSARTNRDVMPIDGAEFQKLRGRWQGAEVGRAADWTFSFGDAYAVVVRDPDSEVYEGFAGFHTELGAGPDGRIHVPPGSGVIDVDVVNASSPRYRGTVSLGTYYFISPTELRLCASRPGVHLRALSYDATSEPVRCFQLTRISGEPSRNTLAERHPPARR